MTIRFLRRNRRVEKVLLWYSKILGVTRLKFEGAIVQGRGGRMKTPEEG